MYSRDIDSLAGAHCLARQTTIELDGRRGAVATVVVFRILAQASGLLKTSCRLTA